MKKLTLSKETLQCLDAESLDVQGGASLAVVCIPTTLTRPSILIRCLTRDGRWTICRPCPEVPGTKLPF